MRAGIRLKLVGYTLGVVGLVGGAIFFGSLREARERIRGAFEEECRGTAVLLARNLGRDLYFLDVASLRSTLGHARVNPDLAYAYVLDMEGRVLTDGSVENPLRGRPRAGGLGERASVADGSISEEEGGVLEVTGPIEMPDGDRLGSLVLGFTMEDVEGVLRATTRTLFSATLICLAVGAFLAIALSRSFTKPIRLIVRATDRIRRGDFRARLGWTRRDELGSLARAVDQMAAGLDRTTVSKDYLDQILQSMSDVVLVTDGEERIQTVNSAAERLLRLPAAELERRSLASLFEEGGEDIAQRSVRGAESILRTKDGRLVPVSLSLSTLRDAEGTARGFVCVARDVRERKRAEEERRVSEERFRSVFERSAAGIAIASPEGRFLEVNPAFCRFLGYSPEELLARSVLDVTHPEDRAETAGLCVASGERPRFVDVEKRYLRKDGSSAWGHVSATWLYGSEARPLYGIALIQDVTARKAAEADLARARDAALESARLKSEFLANMSHEVRTPMTGILGCLDLLEGTELDAGQRRYLGTVRSSAEGLLSLLNDLLDFSKIEAGKFAVEAHEFELRSLVEGVADLFAPAAQEKGLEFLCEVLPRGECWLRGDATRVRQVLLNLVGNAVKFTERGEVEIFAEVRTTAEGSAEARFRVRDTGIGIPRDRRDRLFQPFSQVDGSTTRRFGGTGLGLAISKRLVERMGGRVEVEGEEGRGATFTVTIPFESGSGAFRESEGAAPTFEGVPVLVVEPNESCRASLVRTLQGWGAVVSSAADRAAALGVSKEAESAGRPFAIALVAGERKAGMSAAFAAMPVVWTCTVRESGSVPSSGGGVVPVVTKPVKPSLLEDALRSALAGGEGGRIETPAEIARAISTAGGAGVGGAARILVVDDEPVNREVVRAILDRAGHRVDLARDGREAVARTAEVAYDLVLMDVHMPEMDGHEATRAIRAREEGGRRTPIVALTASAMPGDRERGLGAGMDDYLTKPIRSAELLGMVARWLPAGEPNPEAKGSGAASRYPRVVEALREVGVFDDPAAAGELVRLFLESASRILDEVEAALSRGDARECARLAHRLKGASLSFGADRLGEEASRLEEEAGRLDPPACDRAVGAMREELERVRAFALRLVSVAPAS